MHTKINQTMEKDNENILFVGSRLSYACSPFAQPDVTWRAVSNTGGDTPADLCMAETSQASVAGSHRAYHFQELVTTHRHGAHRRHRVFLHDIHPDHAHLAADDHHDGSQLAGSDRRPHGRSQRYA